MKSVLYIDPPAFCTTIAALDDPSLRQRPVVIAPLGADRAVVIALSAEARAAGLSRDMPVALARRVCPDLIVLPPDPRRWAQAHRALHSILAEVAPVIEPRSWGHCYLDVTGTERLFGPPLDLARRLERTVQQRLGLPLAVGVAGNKLVSETAATVVKREVGADIWPVSAGQEAAFLSPEPVASLPEVPRPVRSRLDDYHLSLIGEVAAVGEQLLTVAFGRVGRVLHRHSRGIDHRPVLPPAVKAACRIAHQFATDTNDRNELRQTLRTLTGQLGQRLRRRGYAAGRLKLTVRHSDDAVAESSARLRSGALDGDLWSAACSALDRALTRRITVRSVTICAEDLHDGHGQLELWPDTAALLDPRAAALQQAMDAMRRAVPRPRTQ